jgi:hypothetical protein
MIINRRSFLKSLMVTPLVFVKLPKLTDPGKPVGNKENVPSEVMRSDNWTSDRSVWRTVNFDKPLHVINGDEIVVHFYVTTSDVVTHATVWH